MLVWAAGPVSCVSRVPYRNKNEHFMNMVVVSVLAFYSDDPSSNPAYVYGFKMTNTCISCINQLNS